MKKLTDFELMLIKIKNSKQVFCKTHKKTKLEFHYNQRLCKICLKNNQKKYSDKKQNAKNNKFAFYGLNKK